MGDLPSREERLQGCLLGLALGDALGAPYEGGFLERLIWRVIGRTKDGKRRWTDDTQMALDTAESIVACRGVSQDDLAARFARSYRWSRGYGPGTTRVLKRIRGGVDWRLAGRDVYPEGSFGNGAAMRAPVVAMYAGWGNQEDLKRAATGVSEVTHAHPHGIEGAYVVASATSAALRGLRSRSILEAAANAATSEDFKMRLRIALDALDGSPPLSPDRVAAELGNGVEANRSCITAVYLAARFCDSEFLAMHAFGVACRGDVDTICAIAGAIWGAANGLSTIPADERYCVEATERIVALALALGQMLNETPPEPSEAEDAVAGER